MTDLTRVFNPETRAMTNIQRRYAGQKYDDDSTTLHFEYTVDFLSLVIPGISWTPYIIFNVPDDEGNPQVYQFDGYAFTLNWDITSRVRKSRDLEYQLWFVKQMSHTDPETGLDVVDDTDYLLSEIDHILLKSSVPDHPKPKNIIDPEDLNVPPNPPAFSPTLEPSIIGWIDEWKRKGVVIPVVQGTDDNGRTTITFYNYDGSQSTTIYINAAPLVDDKLPVEFIPTGHTADTIPLLKDTIADGQSLVYSDDAGGFVGGSATSQAGSGTWAELRQIEQAYDPAHPSIDEGAIYNCTTAATYGGDAYKAGIKWMWFVVRDGNGDITSGHWEPLTAGMDLSAYQSDHIITSWASDVDDAHYPSALLTKNSLDGKVDSNAAITGATKCKITYDSKGLVTAGADLVDTDIPSIPISKVTGLTGRLETDEGRISDIESKIPAQASSSNQLADKNWVNSSIATNTGTFLGTYKALDDADPSTVPPTPTSDSSLGFTQAQVDTMTDPYSAASAAIATALASKIPDPAINDYLFVEMDFTVPETSPDEYRRYKWDGTVWAYEYTLNNSSFTADQWAAINSGITDTLVAQYSGYATGKMNSLPSAPATSSKVLVSIVGDANDITESTITATELGFLSGMTGDPIQTQLNSKQAALTEGSNIDITNNVISVTGIENGAEVNTIESVSVNGTAVTPDANRNVDIAVPTNNNQLTNGAGYQTASDVIKVVKVNSSALTIDTSDRSVDITVPTNNNQLTNGAGYQTASDVSTAISTNNANYYTKTAIQGYFETFTLPAVQESGGVYTYTCSASGNVWQAMVLDAGRAVDAGVSISGSTVSVVSNLDIQGFELRTVSRPA